METDQLSLAIVGYFNDFVQIYQSLNLLEGKNSEYIWKLNNFGGLSREIVFRPNFELLMDSHYQDPEKFKEICDAINQDAVLQRAIDTEISDSRGNVLFDHRFILNYIMRGALFIDDQIELSIEEAERRLKNLRQFIAENNFYDVALIPLPGITVVNYPLEIEPGIVIDKFSPEEVGRCIETGVLRFLGQYSSVNRERYGFGVRIKVDSLRVLGSNALVNPLSDNFSASVPNTFGDWSI